jgi:hypothetical protein
LAHSKHDTIITVLSGSCTGVIWQDGWVYPFREFDSFGAKAGTGKSWTILNAPHLLNGDEPTNSNPDLVILVMQENHEQDEDEIYYQSQTDRPGSNVRIWANPPSQAAIGPYPGTADPSVHTDHPEAQGPVLLEYLHAPAQVAPYASGSRWRKEVNIAEVMGLKNRTTVKWQVYPPGTRTSGMSYNLIYT